MKDKNIAAFVCIKLKSQRLPNKMTLKLGNKKLCQHIFDTLVDLKNNSNYNINIYCFCSDERIKDLLPEDVIFLKRDPKLDSNTTKGMEIYQEFMKLVSSDIYLLCHATSPFVKKESIIKGLDGIMDKDYDSSFSCSRIQTFCWYNNLTLNYSLDDIVQTQNIKPIFSETSAFYAFKKEVLENKRRIGDNPLLVETDYRESVDIDEHRDYELALKLI